MSMLKTISSNIIREKEITKKKERQFENNSWSQLFESIFPVVQKEFHDEELRKRLAETCRYRGCSETANKCKSLHDRLVDARNGFGFQESM